MNKLQKLTKCVLLSLFVVCASSVIDVAGMNIADPNWSWKQNDKSKLIEVLKGLSENQQIEKAYVQAQINMCDFKDQKIKYQQFKQLVDSDKFGGVIVTFILMDPQGQPYWLDCLNDEHITNYFKLILLIDGCYYQVHTKKVISEQEWRDRLMSNSYIFDRGISSNMVERILRSYNTCLNGIPEDVAKQDLKKLKRAFYSKIDEDPSWKKNIIKIELMLKSLE